MTATPALSAGRTNALAERPGGEHDALERRRRERTLRGDTTISYLLVREGFRRTVGVNSLVGMVIATVVIGRELDHMTAFRKVRLGRPSFASTMIGGAGLKESLDSVGGPAIRAMPYGSAMIAFGLLSPGFRGIETMLLAAPRGLRAVVRSVFRGD